MNFSLMDFKHPISLTVKMVNQKECLKCLRSHYKCVCKVTFKGGSITGNILM